MDKDSYSHLIKELNSPNIKDRKKLYKWAEKILNSDDLDSNSINEIVNLVVTSNIFTKRQVDSIKLFMVDEDNVLFE